MGGDLYRDAHVGIRARLGELEARIQEREAEVTEAFWAALAPQARDHLDALRQGRELCAADSLDELTRAEGMLAAYLAEMERLIGELPALEASWTELPPEVPDHVVPELRAAGQNQPSDALSAEMLARFSAIVRARAHDAEIHVKTPVYLARFREKDCPFVLRAVLPSWSNGEAAEVAMCLVTAIPRALPRLLVRHESIVLTIGKALGIKHEVEVGDPSFDGLFLIEGTQAAADLFLVPAVRTQLMALARFDVPTLDIDPASHLAALYWSFEPAAKAVDAAVRILTAVRQSPTSVAFRSALSEDDR